MQNSGDFTIIPVNYQFPRLVKPGAGNTQKRCEFLWYLDAPRWQETKSSCDFQDFFNFYGFWRKCVFGRKRCRIHEGRFKVILTTSKTLIFLRNYCYFCPRGRRRVGNHKRRENINNSSKLCYISVNYEELL